MNKKILLVEPGYKTKYPPLGLMKISTYHRKIKGDNVTFVKGCSLKVRDDLWDRVYITSSFTYTWAETIKTINFYRDTLFSLARRIYIGGILATIMPDALFDATGIMPTIGLLNDPTKINQDDDVIIDALPPDYDILSQVENDNFHYAHTDAYLGYTTRGCFRHCEFCAVDKLEPEYIHYIDIRKLIEEVKDIYGEKQNLLLMDNNVLHSKYFNQIIDDIKSAGFVKGATFGKTKRKRMVDFNQGLDARLLTTDKMRKLAEIPLEPMRIAFDDIKYKDTYIKAVRLAHEFGQKVMSNYILYNCKDTPSDFYERLKINIVLNEEFHNNSEVRTVIYSFPMRFIPLDATSRNVDTGNRFWNKRYLRGLQVILNVMKGPVMPGPDFFYQAFGNNPDEFIAVLLMPDEFIRHRLKPNWHKIKDRDNQRMPYVRDWFYKYFDLSSVEREFLIASLADNHIQQIKKCVEITSSKNLKKLLTYHLEAEDIVRKNK